MEIIGRLTRDAELRTVSDNREVVVFSVAVNDTYKNKKGEYVQKTEYFNCSYFIGVGILKYLTRGLLVHLSGWVTPWAWKDEQGNPKAGLNFQTAKITLFGGRQKNQTTQQANTATAENIEVHWQEVTPEGDDLPF